MEPHDHRNRGNRGDDRDKDDLRGGVDGEPEELGEPGVHLLSADAERSRDARERCDDGQHVDQVPSEPPNPIAQQRVQ